MSHDVARFLLTIGLFHLKWTCNINVIATLLQCIAKLLQRCNNWMLTKKSRAIEFVIIIHISLLKTFSTCILWWWLEYTWSQHSDSRLNNVRQVHPTCTRISGPWLEWHRSPE